MTKFSLKRNPAKKVFATSQSVIKWFITIIFFTAGRHQDEGILKWFNSLVEWLESAHLLSCIQKWLSFLMELKFTW